MRREVWISFGLIFGTFVVFAPVLAGDFVNIDDGIYVTGNATVKSGLTLANLRKGLSPDIGHWHPLTWWSYMLDVQVFGVSAGGMHLTNLLLHLANTVLLFLLLNRMTGAVWRSAFVAALFALHPLHVEPVAWVSSRKDVLSTLFLLLTLRAYYGYTRKPGLAKMAGVAVLFALGLMAKPTLVALPLMLLLLDYWPLHRANGMTAHDAWPLVREKIALFALSAASCFLTFYAASTWGAVGHETITFPLTTRIAVAIVAYVAYLYKIIWPMRLAAYYPHPGATFALWQVGGSALLLTAITAAAVAIRRRAPYVLVGWLWFVLSLLPVIGVVQIGRHWIADRYTYVPIVGLFIAVTWLAADIVGRTTRRQQGPAAVAVALVAGFACLSAAQVRVWRNSESLWNHAIEVTPDNYLAHGNLGSCLAKQGRLDEAIPQFANAMRIEPTFVTAYYNLGLALMIQDRPEEALGPLASAVKLKPDHVEALVLLGQAHLALGQRREAVAVFEQALRLNPGNETARALLKQAAGEE